MNRRGESGRRTTTARTDPDRLVLRKASRKVSLVLASVCAAVVLIVILVTLAFIAQRSQPSEMLEHALKPRSIYFGSDDLVIGLIGAGVLGVALAAVVGLLSARQAIRPLAEALAAQRRFVQDASHELRTPLAILDARLQLAQRQAGPGNPAAATLERLRRDSAALAELINDLLLMSTSRPAPDERSDVSSVVTGVIDDLQELSTQGGIDLRAQVAGDAWVAMSPVTLRRIVMALVENALAHTITGGHVAVAVATTGPIVTVTVKDDGTGINGIDPSRIFDRFARGRATGEQVVRGYGIGLALVKEAVLNNGGDVRVTETGADGTAISVTLPAAS